MKINLEGGHYILLFLYWANEGRIFISKNVSINIVSIMDHIRHHLVLPRDTQTEERESESRSIKRNCI